MGWTRRAVLRGAAGTLAGAVTGGLATACRAPDPGTPLAHAPGQPGPATGLRLAPTRACTDGAATPREIEGPFYLPRSPRRRSLLGPGVEGDRVRLVGRVVDTSCRPLPGAVLDFWQADAGGVYDEEGPRLRGHLFADAEGAYRLETVLPGSYRTGWFERTPHLHVKAQGQGTRLLTTQLYFPRFPEQNAADRYYHDELLLAREQGAEAILRFDFVLAGTLFGG